jgi:hypothetical protein
MRKCTSNNKNKSKLQTSNTPHFLNGGQYSIAGIRCDIVVSSEFNNKDFCEKQTSTKFQFGADSHTNYTNWNITSAKISIWTLIAQIYTNWSVTTAKILIEQQYYTKKWFYNMKKWLCTTKSGSTPRKNGSAPRKNRSAP